MAQQINKLQTRGRCLNHASLHDKTSNLRPLIFSVGVFVGHIRDIILLRRVHSGPLES